MSQCGDESDFNGSDNSSQGSKTDFCSSSKKKSRSNDKCEMDEKTKDMINKIQKCYAKCKGKSDKR